MLLTGSTAILDFEPGTTINGNISSSGSGPQQFVGVDGNGHHYSGDTCIIDPLGRLVAGMSHKESIVSGVFSAAILKEYRQAFPAWMDADQELLK